MTGGTTSLDITVRRAAMPSRVPAKPMSGRGEPRRDRVRRMAMTTGVRRCTALLVVGLLSACADEGGGGDCVSRYGGVVSAPTWPRFEGRASGARRTWSCRVDPGSSKRRRHRQPRRRGSRPGRRRAQPQWPGRRLAQFDVWGASTRKVGARAFGASASTSRSAFAGPPATAALRAREAARYG